MDIISIIATIAQGAYPISALLIAVAVVLLSLSVLVRVIGRKGVRQIIKRLLKRKRKRKG